MAKKIVPSGEYKNPVMFEFLKDFDYTLGFGVKIDVFAETRYILYVNDNYVAEGPCRGPKHLRYYDTIDITKYLVKGTNNLRVRVFFQPSKRHFTSVFKGEKPGLILSCRSDKSDIIIETNSDWLCRKIDSCNFDYNGDITRFMPPFEVINLPERYSQKNIEEVGEFIFDEKLNNVYGQIQEYELRKRPIPMIYPSEKKGLKVINKGDGFIELSADEYITGRVNITFDTPEEAVVKVIYAESYWFDDQKNIRDDITGQIQGPFDLIHIKGKQEYSTFWFRAFRFIRIESENVEQIVKKINYQDIHYPLQIQGDFFSSSEAYNEMYRISKTTLISCMHEIFVDCPFYEQQQYCMDTALEAVASLQLSSDTTLIKKAIYDIASSQNPDGLLSANAPCEYLQVIPGFQFFWIILLNEYMEYSSDFKYVSEFIGTLCKVLNYFSVRTDEDNMIPVSRYWDFVDWVNEWELGVPSSDKDDTITVYNMMHVYALKCAENICLKCGMPGLGSDFADRRKIITKSINRLFFDDDREMYADSKNKKTFSQHTIIWSVMADIINANNQAMINHLFSPDILKCSFAMKFYLILALEKLGMEDKIYELIDDWNIMIQKGTKTWWETLDSPRSDCHAWSSAAPLYVFNKLVLGLRKIDNEKKSIIIQPPYDINLEYASGMVPTVDDCISINWEKKLNNIKISVSAKKDWEVVLVLPNKTEKRFTNRIDNYEIKI